MPLGVTKTMNEIQITLQSNKCRTVEPCPNFDKAFDYSKFGKVLGINFDTKGLTWEVPNEKV